MYLRKKIGEYKTGKCPFCSENATAMNYEQIPVCLKHKKNGLGKMKCLCGSTLELKQGKWGPFFVCMSCGTMNLKKALEINGLGP